MHMVFITTYALTTGVYLGTGEISEDGKTFKCTEHPRRGEFYLKPNWHETEEEAVKKVKDMQRRKIESLKKGLTRVSNLVPYILVREAGE